MLLAPASHLTTPGCAQADDGPDRTGGGAWPSRSAPAPGTTSALAPNRASANLGAYHDSNVGATSHLAPGGCAQRDGGGARYSRFQVNVIYFQRK
jgi:hypothetical protein